MYATQTDLETYWGTTNIAYWSDLDNQSATPTANTVRIAAALAYAEARCNGILGGGPYVVPIQGTDEAVPAVLVHHVVVLAGHWLYVSRGLDDDEKGKRVARLQQDSLTELDRIRSGNLQLAAVRRVSQPSIPTIVL